MFRLRRVLLVALLGVGLFTVDQPPTRADTPISGTFTETFDTSSLRDRAVNTEWDTQTGELRLSRSDSVAQQYPAAAVDRDGNLIVVWQDRRNDGGDIYAQKLSPNGARLWAADVRVNVPTGTPSKQEAPTVAVVPDGSAILVAWWDDRNANLSAIPPVTNYDIYGQILTANGRPISATSSSDLRINSDPITSGNDQIFPAAVFADGGFVVAWQEARVVRPVAPHIRPWRIVAQRIGIAGQKGWLEDKALSATIPDDDDIFAHQFRPTLAVITDTVVAAWQDTRPDGGTDIYAQRFELQRGDLKWTTDIQVSSPPGAPLLERYVPAIAANPAGNIFIAWVDTRTGTQFSVWGQWLMADGSKPMLAPQNVPVSGLGSNATFYKTSAGMDAEGNAYVAWEDLGPAVLLQKIGPSGGRLLANDVSVSTSDLGAAYPNIVMNADQSLNIAWTKSNGERGGIYTRTFNNRGESPQTYPIRISTPTGTTFVPFGEAVSKVVGTLPVTITRATLRAKCVPETCEGAQFALSNDNGVSWRPVNPSIPIIFRSAGQQLRWRVAMQAPAEPTVSPVVQQIDIDYTNARQTTFMFYVAGDNNLGARLERSRQGLLTSLARAPNEHINVAVLYDGPATNDLRVEVYYWTATGLVAQNLLPLGTGEDKRNSGTPETLTWFVKTVLDQFPSEKYYLNISDHGSGELGLAWDGQGGVWTGGQFLSPTELRLALDAALGDNQKIDIIHLETCLTGMLEMAHELREYARYLILSPGLYWSSYPYASYVQLVTPTSTLTTSDLAIQIADTYFQTPDLSKQPLTVSVLDLSGVTSVTIALDVLSREISGSLRSVPNLANRVLSLRSGTTTTVFPAHELATMSDETPYVDLDSFARVLSGTEDVGAGIRLAAHILSDRMKPGAGFVVANRSRPGVVERTGHVWNFPPAASVSIYFPQQPGDPNTCQSYRSYMLDRNLYVFSRDSLWSETLLALFTAQGLANKSCDSAIPPDPGGAIPGPTVTPTPTLTPTSISTSTSTPSPAPTLTSTPTPSPTATATPTVTPTEVLSATETPVPTPTAADTPTVQPPTVPPPTSVTPELPERSFFPVIAR